MPEPIETEPPGDPVPPPVEAPKSLPRLLIVTADPKARNSLTLNDDEAAVIRRELAGLYDVMEVQGVTTRGLADLLRSFRPRVVHFGRESLPTTESNPAEPIGAYSIAWRFQGLPETPRCVVLNACATREIAERLAETVGCVVGTEAEVSIEDALSFAEGFYRGLAAGKDFRDAFELGSERIDRDSLPDALLPRFTTREADGDAADDEELTGEFERFRGIRSRRGFGLIPGTDEAGRPRSVIAGNAGQSVADPRLYPLWFGTNRKPEDPADPFSAFTAEDDQQLYLGTCQVSVPKAHTIGSVGSGWWHRWTRWTDDRLALISLSRQLDAPFWAGVTASLRALPLGSRSAVVFIHGFNVKFEEAACRAAQMGFDLQLPGLMAFYSWPSKGQPWPLDYTADEETIAASEPYLTEFLVRFATVSGAERVHVIAHSMGNRGLARSLENVIRRAGSATRLPFGQIVLAAPDIDERTFRNLAIFFPQAATRTTLYASSKDRALKYSGIVHDRPRAGYTPPLTVVPPIDTVDVSNVDLSFLGHGYYAAARDLLHDLSALIVNDLPPDRRFGLKPSVNAIGLPCWSIGK